MLVLVRKLISSLVYSLTALVLLMGISLVWQEAPDLIRQLSTGENRQISKLSRPIKFLNVTTISATSYSYIIRLHNKNGSFFCSGFVISNQYAITAAHCVVDILKNMKTEPFDVKSSHQEITTEAKAIAIDNGADYALISGDFSAFNKIKVLVDPNELYSNGQFGQGYYQTCGYPRGDILTCYPVQLVSNDYFQIKAKGFLFPGMSGGPVIDMDRNMVIALNSAVREDIVLLSPLIGLFINFGIQVEQ